MQAPTAPVFLCQKSRRRGNVTNPDDGRLEEVKLRSAYHGETPEDDNRGHDRHADE